MPVLLLHCSASSGRQWDGLAAMLDGGLRPVAPDLHGYGEAPAWTGPGALSLAAEAARASASLPADASFHLVGHSYGGAVALRLAVEQPWRVHSLTLIEPVAFHALQRGTVEDRRLLGSVRKVADKVIEGVLSGDYQQAMETFVDYWSGPGAWNRIDADARRRFARYAPKVVLDFHAAINDDTPVDRYRSHISCPVQLIRGERSPAPARRIAGLLSETINGARLDTVAGAGHMLPVTHPDAVNGAILGHIRDSVDLGRRAA